MKNLFDFLDKYSTVVVCEIKDLPADFIHKIRKELRTIESEAICGKTVKIYP
jgi:ribosomal protein L10